MAGNKLLICGRRESKLSEAKKQFPQLHTRVCNLSSTSAREEIYHWATSGFPNINMLFNNAGMQKEVDFTTGASGLYDNNESEVEINLTAGIPLASLFIPHFLSKIRRVQLSISHPDWLLFRLSLYPYIVQQFYQKLLNKIATGQD